MKVVTNPDCPTVANIAATVLEFVTRDNLEVCEIIHDSGWLGFFVSSLSLHANDTVTLNNLVEAIGNITAVHYTFRDEIMKQEILPVL
jgi:hypothetical protein